MSKPPFLTLLVVVVLAGCATTRSPEAPPSQHTPHGDPSGIWYGIYQYDHQTRYPVGHVLMILTMDGNGVSFKGRHYEANEWGRQGKDPTLECDVIGNLDDYRSLTFFHTYDGKGGQHHSLKYEGVINESGDTIEGTWSVGKDWTGTFVFKRLDFGVFQDHITTAVSPSADTTRPTPPGQ